MTTPNPYDAIYYDLDEWMEGDEPEWTVDPPVPPPDAERADRMLWRLRRMHSEHAREVEQAEQRMEQITAWLDERTTRHLSQVAWLEGALGRYHAGILATNPTAKTVHLPSGSLVSRTKPPTWVFDEVAFLAWAREHLPAAVRYPDPPPPSIDKAGAKTALTRRDDKGKALAYGVTSDGEKPPGLAVVEGDREYTVKFDDDKE